MASGGYNRVKIWAHGTPRPLPSPPHPHCKHTHTHYTHSSTPVVCSLACQCTGRYSTLPPLSPPRAAWPANRCVFSISWDTSRKSSTKKKQQHKEALSTLPGRDEKEFVDTHTCKTQTRTSPLLAPTSAKYFHGYLNGCGPKDTHTTRVQTWGALPLQL